MRFVPVRGGTRITGQEETPVVGGKGDLAEVGCGSAESLVPDLVPLGIDPDRPDVVASEVALGLVPVRRGAGPPGYKVAPVGGKRGPVAFVEAGPAVGFVPDHVPVGVDLDHPDVASTDGGGRFVSAGRGVRKTDQKKAAVGGGEGRPGFVGAGPAVGFVPDHVSGGIDPDGPKVLVSRSQIGLVTSCPRGGIPEQQEPAVVGGERGICVIPARPAVGFVPDLVAVAVDLDRPVVLLSKRGVALVAPGLRIGIAEHEIAPVGCCHEGGRRFVEGPAVPFVPSLVAVGIELDRPIVALAS